MSNESQLPVYSVPNEGGTTYRYYLRTYSQGDGIDTEITKDQYDGIIAWGDYKGKQALSERGNSLSESDIVRLHQEQDPASEYYKGGYKNEPSETAAEAEGIKSTAIYDTGTKDIATAAENIPDRPTTEAIAPPSGDKQPEEVPATEQSTTIAAETISGQQTVSGAPKDSIPAATGEETKTE